MEDTHPERREAPVGAAMAFTSRSHPQSASSRQRHAGETICQSVPSHLIHAPRLESESLQIIDLDLEGGDIDGGAAPRHLKGGDVIGGSAPHHLEGGDVLVGSAPHPLNGGDVIGGAALHQLHVSKIQEANAGYLQQESVEIDVVHPSSSETNEGKNRLKRGLLRAAYTGDWRFAKAILDKNPEIIRCRITKEKDTVLHNAVAAKQTTFVTELLKLMTMGDLEIESKYKFTALHVAAETGVVRMAKEIVEKNDKLPLMNDVRGVKPLFIAANLGHRNMVSYLLSVTAFERLTTDERFSLLRATIYNDLYDIALEIAEKILDPKSATAGNTGNDVNGCWTALEELARKRLTNGNESQQSFWKGCSNSWFKGIYTKAWTPSTSAHKLVKELLLNVDCELSSNLALASLFEAAKVGNVEFIIILARTYPDLIWQVDEKNQSLFHIAILYRQRSVFSLIYEIGNNMESLASNIDEESNENMLHLAGRLPPPDRLNIVSGAALQMQQELLWFKEIENIVPQSYVNQKNSEEKTPKEIFTIAHKGLQTNGEKWMKDTANYCMLVATLIATVVFAAALTVPGGDNEETGTPIFLRNNWFMVFFISDAIALFSSSTSIVIFLSILTSRYTEEDFLRSLPTRLVFGLATLLFSMAGMMVAFSAICFLVYKNARAWTPVVIITLASIPVASFVWLHCRLWVDTYKSIVLFRTYKSTFLFRPHKYKLF